MYLYVYMCMSMYIYKYIYIYTGCGELISRVQAFCTEGREFHSQPSQTNDLYN